MDVLAQLERLVGFETVSSAGNLAMIAYLRGFLEARGFTLHQMADASGQKAGLFASIGPPGAGGVLLSGHTDVVPVAGQDWSRPPFRLTRDGTRLYGRGTTDMKGYLAAMLLAADLAAKADLQRPLKLVFSYDEEIGCVGISEMIGGLTGSIGLPEIAIVGEPTGLRVVTGHKGKLALRATCFGQAGHSSLAPRFVNALHLAADFVSGLRGLQAELAQDGVQDPDFDVPYATLHAGRMSGGVALNIVPDRAVIEFELRHLAVQAPEETLTRIHALAERIAARYRADFAGARIEVAVTNRYPGLATDADTRVVKAVQDWAQTSGTGKVAYGTEAGYFAALGIPTVVCGPGSMEGQGHKPDEYIEQAEVMACAAMMERIVQGLAR